MFSVTHIQYQGVGNKPPLKPWYANTRNRGGIMHFPPRVDDLTVTFLILGVGCSDFAGIYFRWRSLHFRCLFVHTPIHRPHNMGWATIADRFWKILTKFVQKHYSNSFGKLGESNLDIFFYLYQIVAVVVSIYSSSSKSM